MEEKKIISSILKNENRIISKINDKLDECYNAIENSNGLISSNYIADFESFTIDLYFSNNGKKMTIEAFDDSINIYTGNKTVKINSDGDVSVE